MFHFPVNVDIEKWKDFLYSRLLDDNRAADSDEQSIAAVYGSATGPREANETVRIRCHVEYSKSLRNTSGRSGFVSTLSRWCWNGARMTCIGAVVSVAVWFWQVTVPASLLLWAYYERFCIKPVKLYHQRTARNISLINRCPTLKDQYSFRPTPYTVMVPGISGHLQTLLHEVIRILPPMEYDREFVRTDDGGVVAVDHVIGEFENDAPVMMLIHGVVGGSHTSYIRWYVDLLRKNGIRSVVLNARGCSYSEMAVPLSVSIHFTEDIRRVVNHVRQVYPDSLLFATAYSLGSNLLTKYLGEEGADTPLSGAIAVANPFDFFKIHDHLLKPFNKHVYNYILTRSLQTFLTKHRNAFASQDGVDVDAVMQATTLQQYDKCVTFGLFGFDSPEHYYQTASGKFYLDGIKVPFLTLQTLDDPIVPREAIPYADFAKNPNLLMATTECGGHIAWLEGWNPSGNNWADRVCVEFVSSILEEQKLKRRSDGPVDIPSELKSSSSNHSYSLRQLR